MEPRAHHVLIGLFTVLALGGALLFALWLGKSSVDRDYAWYEVGFKHAVSGLAEGNAVNYSGIEVGNVVELRLDPQDPRQVRALIRVYGDIPIKADTRASLALANITGSMNIQLSGGTPESERLEGERDDPPLIQADPSPLSSLLANSEELFAQVDRLLTNANRLLSAENAGNLTQTLANLERASASLAGDDLDLTALGERLDATLAQAEATLAPYARLGERADRLTANHEQDIARGLQGIGEIDPAMRELHAALRTLNRLVRRLEESPADVLLGRDPLPEYAP